MENLEKNTDKWKTSQENDGKDQAETSMNNYMNNYNPQKSFRKETHSASFPHDPQKVTLFGHFSDSSIPDIYIADM